MKEQIDIVKKTRSFLLNLVEGLSLEQLNKIPSGFNNNIAWNLGHLVAAQQGVCYTRAGLKTWVDENFYNSFKSGSKPERKFEQREIDEIKELLYSSLDQFEKDYEAGLWTGYAPWTTRYGVELKTIDDAVRFLQFHEGLHLGYVMALKRVTAPVLAS